MTTHPYKMEIEPAGAAKRAPLFPQYRPSERHAAEVIRYVRQAGWLTVLLAALLLWARTEKTPPGYWVVMGTALGALMVLRGALALHTSGHHRTRLADRLSQSREQWFPYLLFGTQTLFLYLLVSVLWFTLPALGVNLHFILHIGLYVLLTLITVRRLIAEWARHKVAVVRLPVQDGLQYTTTVIVTLLVAVAMSHAVSPFGHPITGDNSMPIVIIWVIASLIILCCIILLIDRLFGRRRGE